MKLLLDKDLFRRLIPFHPHGFSSLATPYTVTPTARPEVLIFEPKVFDVTVNLRRSWSNIGK